MSTVVTAAHEPMTLERVIDTAPVGRFQIGIGVACAVIAMIDGFDTQVIGLVAPEIAKAWNVAPAAFGPVFGASLFGGLLGGLFFGFLCDRFGRKPSLVVAMTFFGVLTLATPWTTTIAQLTVLRFLTGFGLGGAFPCIIALTSEYAPARLRASIVSWMFCGFPLGAIAGGLIAAFILPTTGWQSLFVMGGIVPLVLVPLVLLAMPESIRFLALRGRVPAIRHILVSMRLDKAWNGGLNPVLAIRAVPVTSLFRHDRAIGTLLIWWTLFLSLLMAYFLLNWLPLVARSTGIGLQGSVLAIAALNAGTVIGCVLLGPLANRQPGPLLGGAYAAGAVSIALIGQSGHSSLMLLTTSFAAGFFATGAQLCTIAFGAAFYETQVRATGVGWSMGVGRVGGVLGPIFGGLLIGAGVAAPTLFLLTGGVALCAAAAAWLMGTYARVEDRTARRHMR